VAQLKAAECGAIFREKMSGATADRPQLKKLMAKLSAGDVVVTPAVDGLSRDTTDLLMIARDLQKAGAGLRSLARPALDTTGDLPNWCLPCLGLPPSLNAAASWSARHAGGPTPRPRAWCSDGNRSSRFTSSGKPASGSTRARHSAALPEL
jgi:Resolvase, N terminal domain